MPGRRGQSKKARREIVNGVLETAGIHGFEFIPDFVIRLKDHQPHHLILETKGYDERKEVKRSAAMRWCAAVNAHGEFGTWSFVMVDHPSKVNAAIEAIAATS